MEIRKTLLALAAVAAVGGLTACEDGQQVLDHDHVVVYDRDGSVNARQVFDACNGRPVLDQRRLNDNHDGETFVVTCGTATR